MGEITYSEYLKTDVCPECGWYGKNQWNLVWICPKCGEDTDLTAGRFVYESYKPVTVKEQLLHAIFKDTKKLIKFEKRESKDG